MLDLSHILLLLAAALVIALTPGLGIFYVAGRTLAGGRAERLASSVGTGLGGLCGLGLSLVLARRPA